MSKYYDYEYLLNRVYEENIDKSKLRKSIKMKRPQVKYQGRVTYWTNMGDIINTLNRPSSHFITYMETELSCHCNQNDKTVTIIGKYTGSNMETLLRKYISEHIRCRNCRTMDTSLRKNNIICNYCNWRYNTKLAQSCRF